MNWKTGLDKYLTSSPDDDGFENWCDEIDTLFSDEFYNQNEDWIMSSSGQCNKWLNSLFKKGKEPKESAAIIQRAFNIYIKK